MSRSSQSTASSTTEFCTRCGASFTAADAKQRHAETEHDNQPTQFVATLATREVLATAITDLTTLTENYTELSLAEKKGRIIIIREILANYDRVKNLANEDTTPATDAAVETAITALDDFIDGFIAIHQLPPSARTTERHARAQTLGWIRDHLQHTTPDA